MKKDKEMKEQKRTKGSRKALEKAEKRTKGGQKKANNETERLTRARRQASFCVPQDVTS